MTDALLPLRLAKRYFYELRQHHRSLKDARATYPGLPLWDRRSTARFKSSDTLYILGSGTSINWLTSADWDHISSADSLSTNWFSCHPFQPTYYQVEFWPIYAKEWLANYDAKHPNGGPPILINLPHAKDTGIVDELCRRPDAENQYFTVPVRYSGLPKSQLQSQISAHARLNKWFNQDSLVHHGGSLSAAISFGLISGYKRIVLVGIDLSIPGYFYDDAEVWSAPIYDIVRDIRDRALAETMKRIGLKPEDSKVHVAADPRLTQTYKENSVIDVVDAMRVWAESAGARLEIANKSSSLAERLPISELVTVQQRA